MTTIEKTTTREQNAWLTGRISELAELPPGSPERNPFINEIFKHLITTDAVQNWSNSLARRYHLGNERDDVEQIVSMSICRLLATVTPERAQRVQGLHLQNFWGTARHAVCSYQESSENIGFTGAAGVVRRRKQIVKAEIELTKILDREPSNNEVKQYINDRMNERRSNPSKQGMLISDDDFATNFVTLSADQTLNEHDSRTLGDTAADPDSEHQFLRVEVDEAMRALTSHMRQEYPDEPEVVPCTVAWAQSVLSGVEPTAHVIKVDAGCTIADAKRVLALLAHELPQFRLNFA